MTYRIIDRNGITGNWFELRDDRGGVMTREFSNLKWGTYSNILTLEECIEPYRRNLRYSVSVVTPSVYSDYVDYVNKAVNAVLGGITPLANSNNTGTTSVATKHKCTCPWDGPTGVYAVGCKCKGV